RRPPGRRGLLVVCRARVTGGVLPTDRGAAAHHRPVRARVLRGHRRGPADRRPAGPGERAAEDRHRDLGAAAAAARHAGSRQPPDDRPPVPARRHGRDAEHPPAHQRAGAPSGGAVRRAALTGGGANLLTGRPYPSSAVVGELDGEVEVLGLEQADHGLQVVPALGRHAQLLALHLGLHALRALVPDDLGHLLGVVLGDALLQSDRDAVLLAGHLGLRRVEVLERDAALDELLLEHVEDGARALLAVGADFHTVLT